MNMSRSTLNMKERGDRGFTIDEAIQLAEIFGVTVDEMIRARSDLTLRAAQHIIQPEDVVLKKAAEVLIAGLDAMSVEEFPHQRFIRSAGKRNVFGGIRDTKFRTQRAKKSPHTRVLGVYKRSINIE